MADVINMTQGSGATIATRSVDNLMYQRVTSDLVGYEGKVRLGGGNDPDSSTGNFDDATNSILGKTDDGHATNAKTDDGTALTKVIHLENVAIDPAGETTDDDRLVEVVDLDVVSPVRFFRDSDKDIGKLAALLLDRGSAPSITAGSVITLATHFPSILAILPLYPVIPIQIGGVYNYTFKRFIGQHRVIIRPKGTGATSRSMSLVFFNYHDMVWNSSGGEFEVKESRAQNANLMSWRIVFNRTIL